MDCACVVHGLYVEQIGVNHWPRPGISLRRSDPVPPLRLRPIKRRIRPRHRVRQRLRLVFRRHCQKPAADRHLEHPACLRRHRRPCHRLAQPLRDHHRLRLGNIRKNCEKWESAGRARSRHASRGVPWRLKWIRYTALSWTSGLRVPLQTPPRSRFRRNSGLYSCPGPPREGRPDTGHLATNQVASFRLAGCTCDIFMSRQIEACSRHSRCCPVTFENLCTAFRAQNHNNSQGRELRWIEPRLKQLGTTLESPKSQLKGTL